MAIVDRWPIWGGFQREDLSEWIRSRGVGVDRKTWPLQEVTIRGI